MLLYLFYIRKVFLEGTSKSSKAFFTVQERFSPEHSGGMVTASIQVKELSGLGMASCEWIIIGVKKAIGWPGYMASRVPPFVKLPGSSI